ncbi:MAG TPA: hypothetical protein GXX67_06280 [Petrimonas sp.]|nr:hypothetical protein [Petrimonas sp.]
MNTLPARSINPILAIPSCSDALTSPSSRLTNSTFENAARHFMSIKTNDVFPLPEPPKMYQIPVASGVPNASRHSPVNGNFLTSASMTFCSVNARFNAIFIAV